MSNPRLNEAQIDEIVELNKNYVTTFQIAKIFNITTTTVRSYFKKRNIPLLKICTSTVINRRYFENINSEVKSYILGWMFSDGNVYIKNKGSHRISLNVQDRDRFICDLMRKEIGGNINFIDNSNKNWKDQIKFTANSEFLTNDLLALGCMPNKTNYELKIPDIPKELIIHFIRGVFDGDGCISFYKKDKTITFKISCNSIVFLNQIGNFLKDLGVTKFIIISSKNTNCLNLEIKRKLDIKLLYTLLYDNSTLNLSRKRLKWIEYMEQIKY